MLPSTVARREAQRPATPLPFWKRSGKGWFGLLLAMPALVLFAAFAIWPALRVFYLSVFDYNLISEPEFVGFANFEYLIQDSKFHQVLGQTLFYVGFTYIPAIVIALGLALVLVKQFAGSRWIGMAYFLPVSMSWVAVALIWQVAFHKDGLVNQTLGLDVTWLTSSEFAPWALAIMGIWKEMGFFLILFLAGLRTIPEDVIEAAKVDGAGALRRFIHMILPLLMPIIAVCAVMATIRGFQSFSAQTVMTQGAFGTEVINLYIYDMAFASARMGRASAVAVFMFLGLFAVTLLQLLAFRRRDT